MSGDSVVGNQRKPWRSAAWAVGVLVVLLAAAVLVDRGTHLLAAKRGWLDAPLPERATLEGGGPMATNRLEARQVVQVGGLKVASFGDARRMVSYPVKEPSALPAAFWLRQVFLMVPDQDLAQQKIQEEIEAGGTHRTPIQAVYTGPSGSNGPWLSLWQGLGVAASYLEGFPAEARGTLILANGATATWTRGSLALAGDRAISRQTAWQDTDDVDLFWSEGDPVQVGSHKEGDQWVPDYARLGYRLLGRKGLALDELVKVADSLQ